MTDAALIKAIENAKEEARIDRQVCEEDLETLELIGIELAGAIKRVAALANSMTDGRMAVGGSAKFPVSYPKTVDPSGYAQWLAEEMFGDLHASPVIYAAITAAMSKPSHKEANRGH